MAVFCDCSVSWAGAESVLGLTGEPLGRPELRTCRKPCQVPIASRIRIDLPRTMRSSVGSLPSLSSQGPGPQLEQ
jgi:hypothetical protein